LPKRFLKIKICLIFIFLFVGSSFFTSAFTTIKKGSTDSCDIATWCIGDEWIYTADPVYFYSDNGSFDGKIENLKREVVGVTSITHDGEQLEVYKVNITGDIVGVLTWVLISGDLEGTVEGFSYIRVSDLAEVETELVSTGVVKILFIDRDYELINTNLFFPPLELYDFPLKLNDQWFLSCNTLSYGSFTIEGFVDEEYYDIDTLDEIVQCDSIETISVPAGDFDCFKVSYSSNNFWYSPEVGNLVKSVMEQNNKDNTFNMDLTLKSFSRGNQAIIVSENIDPSEAFIGQEINIFGQAVDSNGDPIQNGDISIEIPRIAESWFTSTDDFGFYNITILAPEIVDDTPSEGEFGSDGVVVHCTSGDFEGYIVKTLLIIDDYPPSSPTIEGEKNGKVGVEYVYTFTSFDLDGDDFVFFVDWGDNSPIQTVGPLDPSGVVGKASHKWDKQGTYGIVAKTVDVFGAESSWCDPYPVTMQKNKEMNMPFLNYIQAHPNLILILQKIIQRLGQQ
jgi:hypothetical protein